MTGESQNDCYGKCTYRQAFDRAQRLVDQNEANSLPTATRNQKIAEFALVQAIFDDVQADCDGPKEDGLCSKGGQINDTAKFIFSNPEVRINTTPGVGTGFSRAERD